MVEWKLNVYTICHGVLKIAPQAFVRGFFRSLLVHPGEAVTVPVNRVVLVLLGRDRDSTATLPALRAAVSGPGWRRVAAGTHAEAYERDETAATSRRGDTNCPIR